MIVSVSLIFLDFSPSADDGRWASHSGNSCFSGIAKNGMTEVEPGPGRCSPYWQCVDSPRRRSGARHAPIWPPWLLWMEGKYVRYDIIKYRCLPHAVWQRRLEVACKVAKSNEGVRNCRTRSPAPTLVQEHKVHAMVLVHAFFACRTRTGSEASKHLGCSARGYCRASHTACGRMQLGHSTCRYSLYCM